MRMMMMMMMMHLNAMMHYIKKSFLTLPFVFLTRLMWAEQTATRSSCCSLMAERKELRPSWRNTTLTKRYVDDTQSRNAETHTYAHSTFIYAHVCAPSLSFLSDSAFWNSLWVETSAHISSDPLQSRAAGRWGRNVWNKHSHATHTHTRFTRSRKWVTHWLQLQKRTWFRVQNFFSPWKCSVEDNLGLFRHSVLQDCRHSLNNQIWGR